MFAQKIIGKVIQARFNLLLLEDGEFFLDDFSVYRYLGSIPNAKNKVQGRLKVCTRGFFFEPQDLNLPVLRFPFRNMHRSPVAEIFTSAGDEGSIYLTFTTSLIVEMKDRGVDHPYITIDTEVNNNDHDTIRKPRRSSNAVAMNGTTAPAKYIFALLHSKIEDFLLNLQPIWDLAQKKSILNKIEEEQLLQSVLQPRCTDEFDTSLLVDFRERPLLNRGKIVNRIVPLLKYPGCLMLTTKRLYFQPAQINNVGDPVLNWEYESIEYLYKRRHMLKQTGLEICLKSGESFFFSTTSRDEREEIYDMMVSQPALKRLQDTDLEDMVRKWQNREVSNFDYLMYLNNAAGRTVNDLTQYPVFPWVLTDYKAVKLDLSDPNVYRDLSKPVGALNPERLATFRARFEAMPRGMEAEGIPPPFLYGTHYSTPGYVLFYVVRRAPEYMICLQNGKFDAPDRLFKSIAETWQSCQTNHADLKELIPCFYDEQILSANDWLLNSKNLDLGTTQQLARVGDVELPPWANNSPSEFVRMNRKALESDYVSRHLHEWIDLIFGFKQQGEEAVKADNLFYYLSYEGSVDLETITDPVQKCSFEAQIQEFGQTPKLLFLTPHPARSDIGATIEIAPEDYFKTAGSNSLQSINSSSSITESETRMEIQTEINIENGQSGAESSTTISTMQSVFNFRRRSLGVPVKAQKLVGGITAQIRKRIPKNESSKSWGWGHRTESGGNNEDTTSDKSQTLDWTGSTAYSLHTGEVTSLQFSKDKRALFSTSKDTSFKISAISDGSLRRNLSCNLALSCCDVSPDEKFVFIGSWDNHIYMYSVDFGRVIDSVVAHDDGLSALVVDGERIITASWDSSIKIWHYTPTRILKTCVHTFMECEDAVVSLNLTYDGNRAVAGTQNGVIYLFDLRGCEYLGQFNGSPSGQAEISNAVFSGDGQTILSMTITNELTVFQANTGNCLAKWDIPCSNEQIHCFDSDGEFAVGGTSQGHLFFWKLQDAGSYVSTSKLLVKQIENAHNQAISSISISAQGNMMATASVDGCIRVWSLPPRRKSTLGRMGFF